MGFLFFGVYAISVVFRFLSNLSDLLSFLFKICLGTTLSRHGDVTLDGMSYHSTAVDDKEEDSCT